MPSALRTELSDRDAGDALAGVDHELKLALPRAAAAAVTAWLRSTCRPDPEYPIGLVSSIYFDSRDLASLRESLNGDFLKAKVRLRWYRDAESGRPQEPAFVEIKRKVGGRRFKHRRRAWPPAAELAGLDLQSQRLIDAIDGLRDDGFRVPPGLRPVVEIRFRRLRFVEPASGARVAIDTDICASRANPALLPRIDPFPLAWAVVEIKGPFHDLPPRLVPLRRLGCRREAFSKYARCCQKVAGRASF